MACNLEAMASNLIAMASNLMAMVLSQMAKQITIQQGLQPGPIIWAQVG